MKSCWSIPLALLAVAGLSTDAMAQERQFRKLELVDGRTLEAEVLATEGTGLRMRTPRGETLISFELLMDMVPITQSEFEDQGPDRLWLATSEDNPGLRAIYQAIGGLEVSRKGASKLSPVITQALEACGTDIACARDAISDAEWMWLAFVAPPVDDSTAPLVIRGGPSRAKQVVAMETQADPAALWTSVHESLGLIAPTEIPQSVLDAFPHDAIPEPVGANGWTAKRVNTASFIPIPGYPSLAQGDAGRFALGLGVTLAGTGLAVGASTQIRNKDDSGMDLATLTGVGVGTLLVLTGVMNNALGHATLKANGGESTASASVAPIPGGAQISFTSPL